MIVMAYVSLSEVKVYLWINCSDDDDLLNQLIDISQAKLDKQLGDLTSQNRTEQVTFCDFITTSDWAVEFYANNINVTALVEINNTSYSWIKWTDYRILDWYQWRKLWIDDFEQYISSVMDKYLDIKYTSWYTSIPWDLKELQMKMIQEIYTSDDWKDIKSFKSGPESVSYADTKMSIILNKFEDTLEKYNITNVY